MWSWVKLRLPSESSVLSRVTDGHPEFDDDEPFLTPANQKLKSGHKREERFMQFTRRLRESVRNGEITTSIRIWQSPRVKVGNRYRMADGYIAIDAIHDITLEDITPRLARESGFSSVPDLLRVAKHGSGVHVYLVSFHYEGALVPE